MAVRLRLKMKDLERATGVGRETIRFYIRQGLLPQPERPARNVAWYDESFVERILLIKRLQQERYLPLAVIRALVNETPEPAEAELRILRALDGHVFPHSGANREAEPLEQVQSRTGLPAEEIRRLEAVGFIETEERDGARWLDERSVELLELWAELRQAGFTSELGVEPETTGLYVQFVDWLAREEVRLFTGYVNGRVEAETSWRMAEKGIDVVGRWLVLLHERRLLRWMAEAGAPAPSASRSRRA
jgi:DNA-binding transcriptional MerR regulator